MKDETLDQLARARMTYQRAHKMLAYAAGAFDLCERWFVVLSADPLPLWSQRR